MSTDNPTIDPSAIADSQTVTDAEALYERQKYLRNHELRGEILDAVGAPGSRDRYRSDHVPRDDHKNLLHEEVLPIARYVGADLLTQTKRGLLANIADAVGIDAENIHQDGLGLTRPALKTLHRYLGTHEDSGDHSMCGQIRELARSASPTAVARSSPLSAYQATRHARGHCECDTDVAPIRDHTTVSRSECITWRRRVRYDGVDRQQIADECDRRRTTVGNHVRGACGHDEEELAESPVEPYGAGTALEVCRAVREALAEGGVGPTALARRDDLPARSTIHKHGRGNCRHDDEAVGHPPVATDGSGVVLDAD